MSSEESQFGRGICVGVALSAVLVHVYAIAIGGDLNRLYREFGDVPIPMMTKLTISVVWQIGVPLAAVVAIGALILRRPRALWPYIAVTVAFVLATVCSLYFPQAPIRELAGQIKAE
ncbi:MAG: hypothetical protein QM831_31110 [Kofleriaceae bacterium]